MYSLCFPILILFLPIHYHKKAQEREYIVKLIGSRIGDLKLNERRTLTPSDNFHGSAILRKYASCALELSKCHVTQETIMSSNFHVQIDAEARDATRLIINLGVFHCGRAKISGHESDYAV